ncbi:nucleotide sugar dehydrogenase [Candidatus Pacearchaeota archaeon]|nr:nucleotide sugar dehydrogenase [Candidatus Pacearchaeota archaeon]
MNVLKVLPRVAVIGMGYVGFPLACAIGVSKKYEVYAFDIDSTKIDKINKRISPIDDKRAEKDIKEVSIYATTDSSVLKTMDYIIVCVPTPVDHKHKPDLTPVIQASESIAAHLREGQTIILESTVNPGICEEVVLPILESTGLKGGIDFELAHCPERINPGDEDWNVYNIPRNIGALTSAGTKRIADFYRSFINASVNEVSSIKAAEATKIVENTFRDINIAYVNELAQCFDVMGIDIMEVLKGASNKPFAFMPHYPGCGVGGHCIPVDPYYLISKAKDLGFNHKLLKIARNVNNHMPKYTVDKLVAGLKQSGIPIKGATVGILGLSYKANSGDMRESPALEIKKELVKLGARVLCHDPYCNGHSDSALNSILTNCTGIIVATGHKDFLSIKDWKNVKVIIDGRNCLDKSMIDTTQIYYRGIGRGS